MSSHGSGHERTSTDGHASETSLISEVVFVAIILATSVLSASAVTWFAVAIDVLDWSQLLTSGVNYPKFVFGTSVVLFAAILWSQLRHEEVAIALSVGSVLLGVVSGILLRESIISGLLPLDWVGLVILLSALGMVTWQTVQNQVGHGHHGPDLSGLLKKWSLSAAFLVAFIVTLLFGSYLAPVWNETIGRIADLSLHPDPSATDPKSNQIELLIERTSGLIDLLLVVASGITAIIIIQIISPQLDTLWTYLGLKPEELSAARLLRSAAADAIRTSERLSRIYPKQVNIFPDSEHRRLPFVSKDGDRALIKIYMPEEKAGQAFIESIQDLVASAEIELENSLFFIYSQADLLASHHKSERRPTPSVIAYGSGAELKDLINPPGGAQRGRFSARYTSRFIAALSDGDKPTVKSIVEAARKWALERNPKDDVLLTTKFASASTELKLVMQQMGKCGLRRILLMSEKVPYEYGILGLDDVGRFLLPAGNGVDSDDKHH